MSLEDDIFEKIEIDLHIVLRENATVFVKKLDGDMARLGLQEYMKYLYWLLLEQRDKWPPMNPHSEKILSHMRWLLPQGQGYQRDYRSYKIPPVDLEEKIDAYVVRLAKWCDDSFTSHLWFEYNRVIKSYVSEYKKVYPSKFELAVEGQLRLAFQMYIERDTTGFNFLFRDIFFVTILF